VNHAQPFDALFRGILNKEPHISLILLLNELATTTKYDGFLFHLNLDGENEDSL